MLFRSAEISGDYKWQEAWWVPWWPNMVKITLLKRWAECMYIVQVKLQIV